MRLIESDKLIDSLRANVLIDVTPELEEEIERQPTAFDRERAIDIIARTNSAITVNDKNRALYWMKELEEMIEKGGNE